MAHRVVSFGQPLRRDATFPLDASSFATFVKLSSSSFWSQMSSTLISTRSPRRNDRLFIAPAPRTSSWFSTRRGYAGGVDTPSDVSTGGDDSRGRPPPNKKRRLNGSVSSAAPSSPLWTTSKLRECLKAQVFPHVDRALAELPLPHRYDVKALGAEAIGEVTGTRFSEEYKLGHGRLSPAFEDELASRIRNEVVRLANLPVSGRLSPGDSGNVRNG